MSNENDSRDLDDQIMARMLQDFLTEAQDHLDRLNLNLIQLEEDPEEETVINEIFRTVHTLKGSAGFVGLKEISAISRKMEDIFGEVRKGTYRIARSIIDVMFEGLDVMTSLLEETAANDSSEMDISWILEKLEEIPEDNNLESEEKSDEQEIDSLVSQELSTVYKESYDQLALLKHIVYSSVHLSDPISLAILFSKQIDERTSVERNAVWLAENGKKVVEIAHNGKLIEGTNRRVLEIDTSKVLKRVIHDQLVVWPSSLAEVKQVFSEFESPTLFPIKAQPEAFGFLILDPEETVEVEVFQFLGQFAAMILNISKLHQKVEEQRKVLNEMTEVLFKQNAHLSSIYHVELELMNAADPIQLCRIVVEAVVSELEARRAAAFLIDESSQELVGASVSGGLERIDSMRFPIDKEIPIKQSIETGRVVTYEDHTDKLNIGPNVLENWVVFCFKGKERVQGILVVEIEDEDLADAISILVNYASIVLDNLMLQEKVQNRIAERQ